jgi:hypothetical protein
VNRGLTRALCLLFAALGHLSLLASAQECERTLAAGFLFADVPPKAPQLRVESLVATVKHQSLKITRLEPIQKRRILVLDTTGSKDVISELAGAFTEEIPPNTSVAYGVIIDRLELSGSFNSNPQELRLQLDRLVTKAESGPRTPHADAYGAVIAALDFIEYPVVPTTPSPGSPPALRQRPLNFPRNGARPGDVIILVVDPLALAKIWPDTADTLVARFANDGVRLFTVFANVNPDRDVNNGGDAGLDYWMQFSHRTGGDAHILYTIGTRPDPVWQSERYLWLNSYGWGYAVTVEVPATIPNGARWSVRINDGNNLLREDAHGFSYPDLPLCGDTKKGIPMIAPRLWPL